MSSQRTTPRLQTSAENDTGFPATISGACRPQTAVRAETILLCSSCRNLQHEVAGAPSNNSLMSQAGICLESGAEHQRQASPDRAAEMKSSSAGAPAMPKFPCDSPTRDSQVKNRETPEQVLWQQQRTQWCVPCQRVAFRVHDSTSPLLLPWL